MGTDELMALCQCFPGVQKTLHEDPGNILVYSIGDKKSAYLKTSEPERWRFSIRVTSPSFVE